jgi:hypothetical protein
VPLRNDLRRTKDLHGSLALAVHSHNTRRINVKFQSARQQQQQPLQDY